MKIYGLSKQTSFNSKGLHPRDLVYKQNLQKGLRDSYQIDCKIEDLKSIAGPMELKEMISKFKPKHYQVGENFRANFHIHTRASDGSLTPKSFLEQCRDWANYIFKKKRVSDTLPAFSAAITDHDRVKSVKETIALISQNPEEYKNFKFVTGCEFLFNGYKEPYSAFEAVGLGFNPFDEKLKPLLQGFGSNNKMEDVKKVLDSGGILSWAHPLNTPDKINDDFFAFLKLHGINGVEGNYQYLTYDSEYINKAKPLLEPFIKKFKMFQTGGTDSHGTSIFNAY